MNIESINKLINSKIESDIKIGLEILYRNLESKRFKQHFEGIHPNYGGYLVIRTKDYVIYPVPGRYNISKNMDLYFMGNFIIDLR